MAFWSSNAVAGTLGGGAPDDVVFPPPSQAQYRVPLSFFTVTMTQDVNY